MVNTSKINYKQTKTIKLLRKKYKLTPHYYSTLKRLQQEIRTAQYKWEEDLHSTKLKVNSMTVTL